MKKALIGYTGFVGSNLVRQAEFSDFFNSRNIEEIRGKKFDLIVCAGAPGARWIANKEPDKDAASINKLIGALSTVSADKFVLISTVDVYPVPINVNEDSYINDTMLSPYGKHRRMLEIFVENHFSDYYIIRLPALFGHGLKKNIIYDLLNNNCIEQIHQKGVFQFYNIDYLWKDINKALGNNIQILNIATEPISISMLTREVFGIKFKNQLSSPPPSYNTHTKNSHFWGQKGLYLYTLEEIINDLKKFVNNYRLKSSPAKGIGQKIEVGIVGMGYWGPVLLKNFRSHPEVNVKGICDRNKKNIEKIKEVDTDIKSYPTYDEIISDQNIDLIVIATPATTHYELAKKALLSRKHVLVEKPFVLDIKEGEELVALARKNDSMLMVDHPHIFQKDHEVIKEILKEKKLGNIIHYHSTRADFGLFPKDTNVIWHSLYHDIYIILDLFPQLTPHYVKAAGSSHIINGMEDSAIIAIRFKEGLTAEFHVCLLFPVKERKIIIVGDKKIAYWDYTAQDKIKIYQKSAFYNRKINKVKYQISGDPPETPNCGNLESLRTEVDYLVECIKQRKEPKNSGETALKVVKILQFINEALKKPGVKVNLI